MELNEIKQRLELALRPAKPPTIEEVLELVSRHGVLRGPVDWAFLAWATYIEYATQRIIETFQLTEEEKSQLLDFRDAVRQLLLEAQRQAKAKLISIYRAVMEDAYRLEGMRLYASDGTWIRMTRVAAPKIIIHGVTAKAHFPDVLKLPRERLEQFQLGWRASDEGSVKIRPVMTTTQPWQAFAWAAARYGTLYIYIDSVNLTREGVSVSIRVIARSWRQRWGKKEAIDLVVSLFRHGEWTSLFTMWLGDGGARANKPRRKYELIITGKESWKLGKK
ncbi:MAG: hypothetical protein ACO2PN_04525 [Pyrobaculum sp.]|jgi:hypothetical protein